MKPVRIVSWAVVAAAMCASLAVARSASAEPQFLSRFEGSWTGTGHTRTNIPDSPRNVRCRLSEVGAQAGISLAGTCTAFGIFSREIGADIAYDSATSTYKGIYRGSRSGPSQLSGRRTGHALTLDVKWPRVINGDDRAVMILRNGGDGSFTLEVNDQVPATGELVTTTSIRFSRQ